MASRSGSGGQATFVRLVLGLLGPWYLRSTRAWVAGGLVGTVGCRPWFLGGLCPMAVVALSLRGGCPCSGLPWFYAPWGLLMAWVLGSSLPASDPWGPSAFMTERNSCKTCTIYLACSCTHTFIHSVTGLLYSFCVILWCQTIRIHSYVQCACCWCCLLLVFFIFFLFFSPFVCLQVLHLVSPQRPSDVFCLVCTGVAASCWFGLAFHGLLLSFLSIPSSFPFFLCATNLWSSKGYWKHYGPSQEDLAQSIQCNMCFLSEWAERWYW